MITHQLLTILIQHDLSLWTSSIAVFYRGKTFNLLPDLIFVTQSVKFCFTNTELKLRLVTQSLVLLILINFRSFPREFAVGRVLELPNIVVLNKNEVTFTRICRRNTLLIQRHLVGSPITLLQILKQFMMLESKGFLRYHLIIFTNTSFLSLWRYRPFYDRPEHLPDCHIL